MSDYYSNSESNSESTPEPPPSSRGVYGISVAAELSGIPVQSLRLYERHGLLSPTRSDGGTRRYSADDLARLRRVTALVESGVNLSAIARIIELEDHNASLSESNTGLRAANRDLRKDLADTRRAREPDAEDANSVRA